MVRSKPSLQARHALRASAGSSAEQQEGAQQPAPAAFWSGVTTSIVFGVRLAASGFFTSAVGAVQQPLDDVLKPRSRLPRVTRKPLCLSAITNPPYARARAFRTVGRPRGH